MKKNYQKKIGIFFILSIFITIPYVVHAENSEGYWGTQWSKDSLFNKQVNKLDKDSVDTISVPVLFDADVKSITQNFGDSRGNGSRAHEGLDIMSITGVPVVSPTDAVVRNMGTGNSAGNYVYTINPGGEVFGYLHLDEIAKGIEPGVFLKTGDFIGTVGYSGNAVVSAPHLHFEIQVDGKAIDPYDRIAQNFNIKDQIIFLEEILENLSSSKAKRMALLINTYFKDELLNIENKDIQTPEKIDNTDVQIDIQNIDCSIEYTRLIKLWTRGNDVKQVQRCMNSLGFSTGIIDGIYGPNTYRGITSYQQDTGLKYIDGIVGPETSSALNALGK